MRIVQIGLNTSDVAASLRFYAEAFGFRNGGGQGLWGNTIQVQGLSAEDSAMMWWMVGAQDFRGGSVCLNSLTGCLSGSPAGDHAAARSGCSAYI